MSKIVTNEITSRGNQNIFMPSGSCLDTGGTSHIQFPVGTSEDRSVNPSAGEIKYNSELKTLEYGNGTEWVAMDFYTENEMVTRNGLLLQFDVNDPDSYTDGGRFLYDLSGYSNNGQLRNWPSYTSTTVSGVKCLHLNGSTAGNGDIAITGGNTGAASSSNFYSNWVGGDATHTFEFWAYYPGSGGFDPFNTGSCGNPCLAYGESRFYYDSSGGRRVHAGIRSNEWHQYVVVQNGSYVRAYRDGKRIDPAQEQYGTGSVSFRNNWVTPTAANRPGVIGSRGWANRVNNWYLSCMQWYDRELTEEEIYRNFAARAGRHGLTPTAITSPTLVTSGLRLELDSQGTSAEVFNGSNWRDRTGNGYDGVLQNSPGYWPSAQLLGFNGSSQWVRIDNFAGQLSGSMTFQMWIQSRYTNPTTRGEVLISAHSGTSNRLRWQVDDSFIFVSDILSSSDTRFYHDRLEPGTWHNYALRIDADRNLVTVYLDGKPIPSNEQGSFSGWGASINRFSIGQEWDSTPSEYINAFLGYVLAYNRRLEDWEILQNYNATRTKFTP